ncbi:putative Lysosomal alpha-glucosidase [Daphnia magna]|uniref:Putative Lysosomal alpha-glucosidase n=1 Tax=Daphnia magna TaxID=35525 RepID=A0A164GMC1_9CRUS|nr:putative Lysosomal alpha-glucosidase [Daphnia magna]
MDSTASVMDPTVSVILVPDPTLKLKKSPRWIKFILGFFLLAIVVTAIVVPIVLTTGSPPQTPPYTTMTTTFTSTTTMATTFPPSANNDRIECYPFKNMVEENCTASGCLWDSVNGYPNCYLPDSSVYGYEVCSNSTLFD